MIMSFMVKKNFIKSYQTAFHNWNDKKKMFEKIDFS
jgi:hypothetical protein